MTEPASNGEKRRGRPWWRWLVWIIVAILLLPVMAVLLLQLTPVQDYLRRQGELYLQNKLHTRVKIGYLRARGWRYLELRNVAVSDTSNKALFYSGSLKVHYNLLALLNNEIRVNKLEWDSVLVNAYRHTHDSAFNFQFVIDAFVSPDATPDTLAQETGTTLQFHIRDVKLHQLRLSYLDGLEGMHTVLRLDSLEIDPDELLVNDGVYAFRGISLNGLTGFFRQFYRPKTTVAAAPPPPATDTTAAPFHLLLKQLRIRNSTFWYESEDIGISTAWNVGSFQLNNANIDQDSTRIQAQDIRLSRTRGILTMSAPKDTTPAPLPSTPNTWRVLTSQALLEKITLKYDNNTGPAPGGAGSDPDYNHLLIRDFNTRVGNINYRPDTVSALLHSLSMRDKSGFAVKRAHMYFTFTPQSLSLQDLLVETSRSILRKHIVVNVPSWETVADHLEQLQIRANIDSSRIALGEWLAFVPDSRNNPYMKPLWDKQLTVSAILKGPLSNLDVQHFYVRDNVGNTLQTQGKIFYAANTDSIKANLPSIMLQSGNSALRSWLPPGTMPDTPRLPEQMLITGSFTGGMADMRTELQLKSDIANAALTAHLVNITDSLRARYSLHIPSFQLHPGIMLYDTTMGWISGGLQAEGRGYDLNTMSASAAMQLNNATYNRYTYQDINAKANIAQGRFQLSGQSADTAITAVFDITGLLKDTTLQNLQADIKLERADLYATNWYADPFLLKGALTADFSSLSPSRLEGNAFFTGWQMVTGGNAFTLDTIALRAHYQDQQYLALTGPFGFINANGRVDYTKLGNTFSALINKPLQTPDSTVVDSLLPGQLLEWTASLRWPRSLQAMMPTLRMNNPLDIKGRLNSDSSLLVMNASLPRVSYDSIHVDSLLLDARIQDTSLKAIVSLASLRHPVAPLYHTALLANASAGKLTWDMNLDDVAGKPKYKVGGLVQFLPDSVIVFSLKPELLLNKQQWTAGADNIIRLHKGAPDSANLELAYREQSIRLSTVPDTSSQLPALQADIKDFQLATITGLLAADTMLATGTLNGKAMVRNLDQSPLIATTLQIDSLSFRNTGLGTLTADLQTPQPDAYHIKAGLTGNGNDLQVQGVYDTAINATVNINRFNMAAAEPFTFGNMTRMHGSADGRFTITGTTDKPKVRGNLHFSDAGGTITYVGAPLTLPDETIVLDERGIVFNNFVIADSLQNELVVNGRVNTNDFTNYRFNLDVNAENFMVLGKQQNPDQLYYGPAFIDSRISLRGNMDLPRIDAYVKLRDKSNVTVTIPQDEPGVANREGIMVFVDKDAPVDSAMLAAQDSTRYENPRLKGMMFSGNAEITPQSVIKIIIDQQNGDYVEAKGTANLNATLDPSSKMSLTGRYEIQEGKYQMSLYEVIKRSFAIEKGSFISFNGDAMNADLDITAKYTVYTSASGLVADQLSGKSELERNQYRQRLPFEVYMQIKGELMKPEITFRLDMPEAERNAFSGAVYNRLKQINQITSELNKQVMGLLVLNSFIPDDPSAAGGEGVDVGREARKSVSKILSQQLNNLAGSLIKGVDINFDLQQNEDYSSGSARESTTLNVGVSKNLFNDRLTVAVGSNVYLEGDKSAGNNTGALVGDVSVEYKLTRDGRYRVRVYQRNANETIVQGQVVETGAAFMIVMDYDQFREILGKAKKETRKERLRKKKTDKKS
ncbi:translocation/assembly module TamB domain-containing protein [uncultured Chitinophaga sp.]|uniref:translocation/assembly module TamB domain-containing protein n=1 Tax=uncultured Chitinophaga sp. TaxID=339340 RepID=UPI00262A44EF|nr:translocation/assembly module TamB domain-containing protein [uncultured Chitinophaga sp.]